MENIPLFKVHMPSGAGQVVDEVLDSGFIACGPKTKLFEEKFGEFIGNENMVATNNCTSAIMLSLKIAGIKPGDDVICSSLTCHAVNQAVYQFDANIIWADVDIHNGNISPESIKEHITDNTKAIVYSHWVGRLADINKIISIANKYNLVIIEDAASALGGKYAGEYVGNHSDFTTFSFQAIKHITTGDGGMLSLKDKEIRKRAYRLRNHGNNPQESNKLRSQIDLGFDVYEALGGNYKMNDIAATLGIYQLNHLEGIISKNQRNKDIYDSKLNSVPGLTILHDYDEANSNLLCYTVLVDDRKSFIKKMEENRISCSVVHMRTDRIKLFKKFDVGKLPNLDNFWKKMINIPVGWWITEENVHKISDLIIEG